MNDLLAQESASRKQREDHNGAEQGYLAEFFGEVSQIKSEMEKIQGSLSKLHKAHEESKTVHKVSGMKALRERMEREVEDVLVRAKRVKDQVEKLDRSNVANRKYAGCEEGTPTDRTRTVVTVSLKKGLKDLMSEFQALRQKMRGEYRETIERRFFTVTGHKPDEETVEYIIETGESESFLQRAIQEQGRGKIIETVREIQERHDAVKQMERNLLELHQIFLDISVLVESQGEQLNSIEVHVSKAADYVDKGTSTIRSARKLQRSSRKCMCIAIIILLVVIFVVAAPVLLKLKKNK